MSGKEGGGLGLKGDLGNGWGIGFRLWGPRIWGVCILDEGLSCRKGGFVVWEASSEVLIYS